MIFCESSLKFDKVIIKGGRKNMACFIVPGTEAIVTTIATKIIEKKEASKYSTDDLEKEEIKFQKTELLSTKLKRLNKLLWGGSALLAFEHLWHGEIQPFFPFLTAASNPADAADMLHEMSTVGVAMAVLVTAVWAVSNFVIAKAHSEAKDSKAL